MIKTNFRARLTTFIAGASLVATCAIPNAYARDGVGIGAIVGEPTGVSLKYWVDRNDAIDAAFAWSLADNSPFQFHADYLMHSASLNTNSEVKGTLPWYYGLGGRIKNINNETHLGIRAPLGISYLAAGAPVEAFFEIVPVLDVKPTVDLRLNGAIGLRYYFY